MLKGHVFSEQVFGVDIFALFVNQFLGGNNGIIQSYKDAMAMTNTSNSIEIGTGVVVVQGRYIEEHTGSIINYSKTDSLYCSLVVEIDLGKTNTQTSLEQVKYKILEGENDYPTLTQDDIINRTGNIYQFELARFQNGATGITNFTDRRSYISFDSIYSGIIQDNLTSDSPTSALSARQGKILNEKISISTYQGGAIDPNTTIEPLILTAHSNAPQGQGVFFYIRTYFYGTQENTSNRCQIAYGYRVDQMYFRFYYNNTWSNWHPLVHSIIDDTETVSNTLIGGQYPVYTKRVSVTTAISGGTRLTIPHGITGASAVWLDAANSYFQNRDDSTTYSLPIVYSGSTMQTQVITDLTNIYIDSTAGWNTRWRKVLVLRYLK